jgi:Nitroreductase family
MTTAESKRGADASTLETWRVRDSDFPLASALPDQLNFLLGYAILAPSAHNTQPWLFSVRQDSVALYADATRALPVIDPDDRELIIGCGAALLNLRIALRRFGYQDVVDFFPDSGMDDLLATVRAGPRRAPSTDDTLLFNAIPMRHTSRQKFEARDVPATLLTALEEESGKEGAWLHIVKDDSAQMAVAELISGAEVMLWEDRRYQREMAVWSHPRRSRQRDGIPGYATGLGDLAVLLDPFLARTLSGAAKSGHNSEPGGGTPALVVLGTEGDGRHDWLVAGQAMERILLRAQAEGVSASFLNQPIEVSELRPRLRDLLNRSGFPQLILRLGYGPVVQPTPRRSPHEVLL